MEQEQYISLNVWLAGRSYRIRIKPDEEEEVRKAVKLADDKIRELRGSYAGKDDQDFIAMGLLMYATHSVGVQSGADDIMAQQELTEMIKKIDKALEQ